MSSPARVVRHLAIAQAFAVAVAGSSVDLTLTGIVGTEVAPRPELATLPFSLLFVTAGLTTFVASRGSAMIASSYRPWERGRVQPVGGTA
ncbi:MAG: hypothetical protein ACRYG2_35010 [Janthinobacterium lividum]